ncbi:MAG: MBL fold metallo-hydrolase [Spirochaetales bacterium]|nr:MBL fold metallo-hydrolase [Spirochaetales bacterium]
METADGRRTLGPGEAALENDGRLSLLFVGAGSAFSKKYYQNNLLVVKGTDHALVDCGTRAPEALDLLGVPVTKIENYVVTHSHADHSGGLEEVMLLNRYVTKRRPRIVVAPRYARHLWKRTLAGGAAYNERKGGRWLRFDELWERLPVRRIRGADRERQVATVGGIEFQLFRTMHIPDSASSWRDSSPSYGVVIDRRVLYTSDTRFDPGMLADLDAEFGFEAIFHDCQFFPGGVHAFIEDLGTLPPAIKSKTRLMHYGDAMDGKRARAAELGFAGFVEQWTPYEFPVPST